MMPDSGGGGGGGGEAPRQGELSVRGARIAEGCVGLLDRGFDRYLDDPFDADQNPQVVCSVFWDICVASWHLGLEEGGE